MDPPPLGGRDQGFQDQVEESLKFRGREAGPAVERRVLRKGQERGGTDVMWYSP